MKKSKLLLIVSLVLALTMSLGSTLAYLTDMDSETNTFTMGKVDIELEEEFEKDSPLWPGEQTNKDAKITNKGLTDAWVWMTVVVPGNIAKYVTPVWANGITPDYTTTDATTGDMTYTVLVDAQLTAGQSTDKILDAVKTSDQLDIQEDKIVAVVNGVATPVEGKLEVVVNAYAVQAQGIDSVEDAYAAYNAQWGITGGGSSGEEEQPGEDAVTWTEVGTLAELQAAIADGANLKLTADITVPAGTIIEIPADVEVTLNLNGRTLSAEGMNDETIINNGTLTITGGTVYSVRGKYPLSNKGVMTIDGVKVEATRTMAVGNMASTAQMTIKGDSEIKGINNSGTLTIEDGNFAEYVSGSNVFTVMNNGGNTTVKGGTFEALFRNISGGSATITGGTFSADPSIYVDAENYTVTTNTDGTYTVTAK